MTEAITITLITVVGGGLLTILGTLVAKINHVGKRVNQVGKDATIAREQTQNSHDTNLRDNIDKNHTETIKMFQQIRDDINGLQRSDTSLWDAVDLLRRRK